MDIGTQLLAAVGFESGDGIQVVYVSTVCDCNPVTKADKGKSAPHWKGGASCEGISRPRKIIESSIFKAPTHAVNVRFYCIARDPKVVRNVVPGLARLQRLAY